MAFTSVEIIALVVIVASAIKILVLAIDPKAWLNMAKKLYSRPKLVGFFAFVLAAIVLNYLLSEISIVQVIAVMAFTSLMLLVGLAHDIIPLIKKYESLVKKGSILKRYWFYTIVWIALMLWALAEIFIY